MKLEHMVLVVLTMVKQIVNIKLLSVSRALSILKKFKWTFVVCFTQ